MDGEQQVKVVLLGPVGVGKSSIAARFVLDTFDQDMNSTIGAAFMSSVLNVDGTATKVQIWDTAGQEKYRSLAPMYYRGAAAAIIVYDVQDEVTLEEVSEWADELKRNGPEDILICLVGNKCDMQARPGLARHADELAEQIGAENLHFQASAKTGKNINELFLAIARTLRQRYPQEEEEALGMDGALAGPAAGGGGGGGAGGGQVDLAQGATPAKKGGCCG